MANVQDVVEFESIKPWLGSFLNLDKPRTVSKSANEKAKFSANFETDDEQEIKRLRAAIIECARQRWPNLDIGEAIKAGRLQVPLHNGDALADKAKSKSDATGKQRLREWSRGKQVLTARSEFLPPVVVHENGQQVVLEDEASISRLKNKFFFTGVDAYFAVRFNAYEGVGANGLPGVNAYLAHVESTGKGEKLIARKDPTERFRGHIGLERDENPEGETDNSDW